MAGFVVLVYYLDREDARGRENVPTAYEDSFDLRAQAERFVGRIIKQGCLRIDQPKIESDPGNYTFIEFIPLHRISKITIREAT